MAEEPKSIPVNDVAKPGTTPAGPTSKPVIVGNTPVVSDPMVSKITDGPATPATSTTPSSGGSMKPRLTPTSTGQQVQSQANKEQDAANAQNEPIKKDEEIDKQVRLGELIESGEYNVSINQKKTSSNIATFIGALLGIVLLVSVVVYILADLNVLDLGVKLPFELFK